MAAIVLLPIAADFFTNITLAPFSAADDAAAIPAPPPLTTFTSTAFSTFSALDSVTLTNILNNYTMF